MFRLFQSYVAASILMLQVVSVLSGCCICFTHMLQVYVLNVSSVSDICCIQMGRQEMGRDEPVADGRGARHARRRWSRA